MKAVSIILGVVIVILLGALVFVKPAQGPSSKPTGTTGEGQPYAQSADGHLRVFAPQVNDLAASPVAIAGTVTGGGWFFEASFPVKVLDADGAVLGQGPAQAGSDWMSTGTVPFAATVTFKKPKHATGTIVFMKDNPSGDPKNAAELRLPVKFQ